MFFSVCSERDYDVRQQRVLRRKSERDSVGCVRACVRVCVRVCASRASNCASSASVASEATSANGLAFFSITEAFFSCIVDSEFTCVNKYVTNF